MRQLLVSAWQLELFEALQGCADARLAEIAAKALKETRYHLRYSASWIVRLGDGTAESHARVQNALDELWQFTGELFAEDEVDAAMLAAGIAPSAAPLKASWLARIDAVLAEATLIRPADSVFPWHGRGGVHTEHLGYMLAEMQFLQRAYPGAQW